MKRAPRTSDRTSSRAAAKSSRRSNPRRARYADRARIGIGAVALAATVLAAGCTHYRHPGAGELSGDRACASLDSALSAGGLRDGLTMRGKSTIDVNQYRVRGRFTLTLTPAGDLTFEMTSTSVLGGHREDAVLSFYADTLRVLDRERGRYYEGAEVDALVADGTDVALDLAGMLRLATGWPPECGRIAGVRLDGGSIEGLLDGHGFSLSFERGRLADARWPLPLVGGAIGDTVEATYSWRDGRLSRFVVHAPERRWRIKLVADRP